MTALGKKEDYQINYTTGGPRLASVHLVFVQSHNGFDHSEKSDL